MSIFHSNRPKITLEKLKKSGFERFLSVISILIFIGSCIFLVVMWDTLPDQVPAHFGITGEVNRFGSKWELVVLLIVGVALYLLMHVLEKYPHLHNYPIEITESNAEAAYRISRSLIGFVKNVILILFAMATINSMIIALEWGEGIGLVLLPLIFLGTGLPVIRALVKLMKVNS
ncbi:hypothetical protein JCM9140_2775 [Halalkalibacter wakoensis JCM 9140]|uniref:DUF1648 domain-containing protein n=1 Tax=Halalkalibacter wakoensis JCM 9140 TaxID=1236970 RepID=W4Q4P4_9BACI|nr:DUF1648 domain-containing protein [Halalkalibacter wakoensis]GAE26688.1 hypothetical protein JCM9140_2775 [Halalkalibacter wakoensis JCM 9140]